MNYMIDFFSEKDYPYRYNDFSETYDTWGREIQLFALALDANIESGGIIPCEDLIKFCARGPKYSHVLKHFRQDCFLKKIGALSFKEESYDFTYSEYNLEVQDISNIDQIFPYRYCILWEEDCNDFEWYKIPVEIDDKVLLEFKETLNNLIDQIPQIDFDPRFEILNELTSSKCLSDKGRDFLLFRKYKGKEIENYFSYFFEPCERAVIPVYPQGYRDTVILTPETSSTVKLIERVVTKILDYLPYHLYDKSQDQMFDVLKKFFRYPRTYICRDIAKEGITKPRILLKICLEACAKKAPILQNFTEFFESFSIKGIEALRGHGLGMANALTTLVQVVISVMINNRLSNQGYNTDEFNYYSYNDDFVAMIPYDAVDDYWQVEGEIFSGLSLLRKEEKSFRSDRGFVFCEIYMIMDYESFSEKRLSGKRCVLLSFAFDYIWEAKEFIQGLPPHLEEDLKDKFEEIVSYWGYEFFENEYLYPFTFGGWRSERVLGYSADLVLLDQLEFSSEILGAYKAVQTKTEIIRKGDKQKFSSIWNNLVSDDEIIHHCCPIGSDSFLKNKFKIYHFDQKTSTLVRYLHQERRINTFHRYRKQDISYEEFRDLLSNEDKFIPLEKNIEWIPCDMFIPIIKDPYIQDTPLKNYLTFKGESFCSPLSTNPEDYSIRSYTLKTEKAEEWNSELYLYGKVILDEYQELPINSEQFYIDDKEFSDLPRRIASICKFYRNDIQYPKILINRKKEVGDQKLRVYPDFLSLEEQVSISDKSIRKENVPFIITTSQFLIHSCDCFEEAMEKLDRLVTIESEECSSDSSHSTDSDNSDSMEEYLHAKEEFLKEFRKKGLDEIPYDDIYSFIFDGEEYIDGWTDPVTVARARVRELFNLFYHCSRLVSREEFFRNSVLTRPESEEVHILLKALKDKGYCRELLQVMGYDVPNDEEEDLDTGGLFD